MDAGTMGIVVYQLMMGVGLAAAAGLRAFLPLMVVGVAARFDVIPLQESFAWLASDEALIVLGIAVVVEVLADKIPAVDHVLDAAATLARPVAGAIATAAPLAGIEPVTAMVVGAVLGGAVAGVVHVGKAATRVASTTTTAGLANPVVSVAEDGGSLGASVGSVLAPALTFAVVGVALALTLWWLVLRADPSPA